MKKFKIFLIVFLSTACVVFFIVDILVLRYGAFWKKSPFSSCLVLEEKLCKKGEKVYLKGEFAGLGFWLPKNAKVFAPFDGYFSLTTYFFPVSGDYKQYPGAHIDKKDHSGGIGIAFDQMDWEIDTSKTTQDVEKGEILGKVKEEKINALGHYNLFLLFYDRKGETVGVLPDNFWEFFANDK